MIKTPLTIAVGIAYFSLNASAQVRDSRLLAQHIAALSAAGFSGMADIKVPLPPILKSLRVVGEVNETTEALLALSRESKIEKDANGNNITKGLPGDTVRILMGPKSFAGELLRPDGIITDKSVPGKSRSFMVMNVRGKTDFIFQEVDKAAAELRTYLVSVDGNLEAAALTVKIAERTYEIKPLEKGKAQEYFNSELKHWMKYYRENIKLAQKT